MGPSFHTWVVWVLEIKIFPLSKIGWVESFALQIWSALPLKMYDHVALEYPDHLWFLPSWKCVDHTLWWTILPVQQCPGPSCYGSFCRCETCTHDIWGSWCTSRTPQGRWTYLLNLLRTLQPYSCIRPQSPTWYCWCRLGREKMNVYGSSRGMHFLIPGFLRLMPWIPLVPVTLCFHKPLLHKIMHTTPLFPLPYSFFIHIESYCSSQPFLLRGSPQQQLRKLGIIMFAT